MAIRVVSWIVLIPQRPISFLAVCRQSPETATALKPCFPQRCLLSSRIFLFFYKSQKRYSEAAGLHYRALEIFEAALDPTHPKLAALPENYEQLLLEMS